MESVGYYNGEIGKLEDIKCPILDRAVYFGDGCYDASYVIKGKVFFLDDHLDRFYNSIRLMRIDFPYEREELKKIIDSVVKEFDGEVGFFYIQTSRGTAPRNHAFPVGVKANLMMMVVPSQITPVDKVFTTISMEDTRFLHCNIKTLNLIPSVMAIQKANEAGCDEVIFHRNGIVTEMGHSNVSIIKDGALIVHPFDNKILPGIAIKHLLRYAQELGIPHYEREFSLVECMNADEMIITSSGTLCNRIVSVDKVPVGGKAPEVLKKLQDAAWKETLPYFD